MLRDVETWRPMLEQLSREPCRCPGFYERIAEGVRRNGVDRGRRSRLTPIRRSIERRGSLGTSRISRTFTPDLLPSGRPGLDDDGAGAAPLRRGGRGPAQQG